LAHLHIREDGHQVLRVAEKMLGVFHGTNNPHREIKLHLTNSYLEPCTMKDFFLGLFNVKRM